MNRIPSRSDRPGFADMRIRFCSRVVAVAHWVAGKCIHRSRQMELMRDIQEREVRAEQCDIERDFKEQAVEAVNVIGKAAIGLKDEHKRLLFFVEDIASLIERDEIEEARRMLIKSGFIRKNIEKKGDRDA